MHWHSDQLITTITMLKLSAATGPNFLIPM